MTALSSDLAGRDVTASPDWQRITEREAFGHGRFRGYLDPEAFREFKRKYVLFHNPVGLDANGASARGVLDKVLQVVDGGASFASLADRVRRGISLEGNSVGSDFASGGGNYFFTRIQG